MLITLHIRPSGNPAHASRDIADPSRPHGSASRVSSPAIAQLDVAPDARRRTFATPFRSEVERLEVPFFEEAEDGLEQLFGEAAQG